MLKKLHWLFVKSFIGPFIGTFFISLFLFLMQTIWKYLGDLVGKGLGLSVIGEFIFYFAIHLIPMALPMALLLSSIMVFGNLAERYELAAIKSAGVSLIRAMVPMYIIAAILSVAAFFTANYFIPKANLSWGALLWDVSNKKPAMNIVDNVFFNDIDGYALKVGKKHKDNKTIEDIIIYVDDNKNKGNNTVLLAKKGKMEVTEDKNFMILELEDGKRYSEMVTDPKYAETMPHNTMSFKKYSLSIDLTALQFKRTDKERFSEDQRMLNVDELQFRIDSLNKYIQRKKGSLYRYLDPYFHEASDTIVIEESDVEDRLAAVLAMANNTQGNVVKKRRIFKNKKDEDEDVRPEISKAQYNTSSAVTNALQNTSNVIGMNKTNSNTTTVQNEMRIKYQIEWHRKFTLAVSLIVLLFVGAPLGAIIKKGGFGLPLVISILMFIVYHLINVFGEKLALEGKLSAASGMWMSTMILLPIAIFLTYKASTDSNLFDFDYYKRTWRLVKRKFGK